MIGLAGLRELMKGKQKALRDIDKLQRVVMHHETVQTTESLLVNE